MGLLGLVAIKGVINMGLRTKLFPMGVIPKPWTENYKVLQLPNYCNLDEMMFSGDRNFIIGVRGALFRVSTSSAKLCYSSQGLAVGAPTSYISNPPIIGAEPTSTGFRVIDIEVSSSSEDITEVYSTETELPPELYCFGYASNSNNNTCSVVDIANGKRYTWTGGNWATPTISDVSNYIGAGGSRACFSGEQSTYVRYASSLMITSKNSTSGGNPSNPFFTFTSNNAPYLEGNNSSTCVPEGKMGIRVNRGSTSSYGFYWSSGRQGLNEMQVQSGGNPYFKIVEGSDANFGYVKSIAMPNEQTGWAYVLSEKDGVDYIFYAQLNSSSPYIGTPTKRMEAGPIKGLFIYRSSSSTNYVIAYDENKGVLRIPADVLQGMMEDI